jgi:hypothetical protein
MKMMNPYYGEGIALIENDFMKNPIKQLKDTSRRKGRQRQIMGDKATHRQERQQLKGGNAAKDTVKRVGEYKAAMKKKNAKQMGCGGKVKRMSRGGQVSRGMGCAIKGGQYHKDG